MKRRKKLVRRDIWSLEVDDPIVLAYGDAVASMKAKPADDPTSWSYQAAIHGTHEASPPMLANECRHQSWYFAPWHRMYLLYFERIVRAEVRANGGPKDWALPFWDYDRVGTRTLPLAFRQPRRPDGSANPLFVADRNPGINSGAAALPPAITSAAFALSRPLYTGTVEFGGGQAAAPGQFQGRTGRLEATPHNDVHVAIGGLMGDPGTAAADPIFWLHHANIDRLWWTWDEDGHDNPTEAAWRSQAFEFFDETGKPAALTCADVLDIAKQLHYTYEDHPSFGNLRLPDRRLERFRRRAPQPPWIEELPNVPVASAGDGVPTPEPEIVGATEEPVRLVGASAHVRLAVDARARSQALLDAEPQQIVLDIENIDADENPGTVYGIYVNLPDDPSPEDLAAHHAGNVSFFGIERTRESRRDEPAHGMQVAIDITGLVAQLGERGSWSDDELRVTFRPIELEVTEEAAEPEALRAELHRAVGHEHAPVEIGRVSLHVR